IYDILSGRGVDLNYTKDYVFSIQYIDYFVCIDDHGVNHHSKRYFAVAKIGDQILVNDTNFNGSHMHSVNGEISVITDLDRAISSTRGLIGRVKNCGHMDERYWSQLTTELEMVEDMV
ncbi:MAG: hypothetical protein KAS32_14495, partial [Candidatus Peribacteraceae bacterium]|nr:hypothetical protein [Candidatus Peribacteraceae bacterium]